MNFLKNLLTLIGAVAVVAVLVIYTKFGGMISGVQSLDKGAMPAYMKMFDTVLKTGNAAEAMVLEYKVQDDVTNDDVAESIIALAEEYNMRITGDIKMFTKDDAKSIEVKHARIFSLCSLSIAKKFLNYSHHYGAFMPCRIMLIELGNGERYLYTMDLTLMIHGGKTLPKPMLELASNVEDAMVSITKRASEGDF